MACEVVPLCWDELRGALGGFPSGSAGKESACNAGDPGSIPGSRRSAGEGISYLLQCSWASLVAQMVKNLPAMQETQLSSLDQKDPLEKGMATYSSILAWRIAWSEEPGGLQLMGSQRVGHDGVTNTHMQLIKVDIIFTLTFCLTVSHCSHGLLNPW